MYLKRLHLKNAYFPHFQGMRTVFQGATKKARKPDSQSSASLNDSLKKKKIHETLIVPKACLLQTALDNIQLNRIFYIYNGVIFFLPLIAQEYLANLLKRTHCLLTFLYGVWDTFVDVFKFHWIDLQSKLSAFITYWQHGVIKKPQHQVAQAVSTSL